MQWDTEQERWQIPVTIGEKTHQIPRRQPDFAVLPTASDYRQPAQHILPALIRTSQQARGFAADIQTEQQETLWPAETMGRRVWRLVNQTGIIEYHLQAHKALRVKPTHCELQINLPTNATPLPLTYTTPAISLTSERYRCSVTGADLQHWLDAQREHHPDITATTTIGDIAFLSTRLQYTLPHITIARPDELRSLRETVRSLQRQAADMQKAVTDWYLVTREYYNSFWLSLFFPSYADQYEVLTAYRDKTLAALPIRQLRDLVKNGFPDEKRTTLPTAWQRLPAIADQLDSVRSELLTTPLQQLTDQLTTQLTIAQSFGPYLTVLKAAYPPETPANPRHQPLQTAQAMPPLTGDYYPLPASNHSQKQRLQSYAYDQLTTETGSPRWRLIAIDADGEPTGTPQVPTVLAGNQRFHIKSEQRYRLYLEQDAAEAWAASHLYLATGDLQDFTADEQHDDSYYLTFRNTLTPATLHYQSRTRDGRVYDTNLTFTTLNEQNYQNPFLQPVIRQMQAAAQVTRLNQSHMAVELVSGNTSPEQNNPEHNLHLKLTLTDQSLNSQRADITARLSQCLERFDQGPDGCIHHQAFTPWHTTLTRQSQHHKKIVAKPATDSASRIHHYLKTYQIDPARPQQLTIRLPRTDQSGNIRGYQQRWYTFYDPAQQYQHEYAQDIAQGTDPIMIRSVMWQLQEAVGQQLPVQSSTLTLIDSAVNAVPAALQTALDTYNDSRRPTDPIYGHYYLDQGTENLSPDDHKDQPFFNPHHAQITRSRPDTPTPIHQGQQFPSFIYPTHELPAGVYTFLQTHTLQADTTNLQCESDQLCIAGLQPAWETGTSHQIAETLTLTLHEPATPPYSDDLLLQPANASTEIAPGIQWQAAETTYVPEQKTLAYAYPVRDTNASEASHTRNETTDTARLPFNSTEQHDLRQALQAMGYQAVTQQLEICDVTTGENLSICEDITPDNVGTLARTLQAYDQMQIIYHNGDILSIELDAHCSILAADSAITTADPAADNRCQLARGAMAHLGVIPPNTTDEDATKITSITLLTQNPGTQDDNTAYTPQKRIRRQIASTAQPTLYVTSRYQHTQTYPEIAAADWIQLPPELAGFIQEGRIYLDPDQTEQDRFCIKVPQHSDQATRSEPDQLSVMIGEDQKVLQRTDNTGTWCLDIAATQAWYDHLQTGQPAEIQIHMNRQDVEYIFALNTYSLSYIRDFLASIAATDPDTPLTIIEAYDPESVQRQFEVVLNTDNLQHILIETFGFTDDTGLSIQLSDGRLQLQTGTGEETTLSPWNSYPAIDGILSLDIDSDQAIDPNLTLQDIPLTGNHWNGTLQTDLTITLTGDSEPLTLSQTTRIELYPYQNPQVLLSWNDYHSQRPMNENTLDARVQASPGQILDLDWVSANLENELNTYYNPILERLYTDQATAETVNALINQVLTEDLTQAAEQEETHWVRASLYPQLHLQVTDVAWEQLSQNLFTIFAIIR
ncbi:MAG: hypothetical protein AAFO08_03365 [Pseudomonadota bacterium]